MKMNFEFKPFVFERALEFFAESFAVNRDFNAALLVKRLGEGAFYVIAPSNVTAERLGQLGTGGMLPVEVKELCGSYAVQPVSNSAAFLAANASHLLSSIKQPRLWIHEPLLTDAEISAKSLPFKQLGTNIYLIVDEELNSQKALEEIIRANNLSWHFLAIATAGAADIDSVDNLISRAELIVVGAYDGESFLFWRPTIATGNEENAGPNYAAIASSCS